MVRCREGHSKLKCGETKSVFWADGYSYELLFGEKLFGNITDLTWETKIAGMDNLDNRLVTTVAKQFRFRSLGCGEFSP